MLEDFLWVEKYRPKTVSDTILTDELKKTFQQFVDQKNIPNLILSGTAGVGKTTVAKAMCEELGCDYIVINGSMNGNIDMLRNDISQFASSVSLMGGRKMVILDEADYLNPQSTQPALRNFMEEFSANCGFILTCNFVDRIIEPLHSRCSVILRNFSDSALTKLIGYMKDKNFTAARKWLGESDIEPTEFFRAFFDKAEDHIAKGSMPQLVLHLAKYQYQNAFSADPEINLMACLTEIMADCEFL